MRSFNSLHPFHLVDISPWPIFMSFNLLSGSFILVNWLTHSFSFFSNSLLFLHLLSFFLIFLSWSRDVLREGKAGFHTSKVQKGLLLGFIFFLITEILLFFTLFWTYFHSSFNPSIEIVYWPPLGIHSVNFLSLPLLNSVLLLSGGFLCTWAHHAFLSGHKTLTLFGLLLGLFLTLLFLFVQFFEYSFSEFSISDSVYGSIFFLTTGLHGFHVFAAVLFLGIATYRIYTDSLTSEHALNLDFSLIYYHLVDLVWIFVFLIFYWWGS